MTTKLFLYCAATSLSILCACSQEKIEDYIFPADGNNVSEFDYFDEDGNQAEYKNFYVFEKIDDNRFKTTEINSLFEDVKARLDGSIISDIFYIFLVRSNAANLAYSALDIERHSTFVVKDDELHLVSVDYLNIITSKSEHVTFNPTQTVLKLPQRSHASEWEFEDICGYQYHCTSEFTKVEINGTKKKAIKLTRKFVRGNYGMPNTITYFVKGLGEWKSCIENSNQLIRLLNRQFLSSVPQKGNTSDSSTTNEQDTIDVETAEGRNSNEVRFPVSTEDENDLEQCRAIIEKWNNAHNAQDGSLFSEIYADPVFYYHTTLSRKACVKNKADLFVKYPDFRQQIIDEISYESINENEIKFSFTKQVSINQKETLYPSYLILTKSEDRWEITCESDLVTDKNLSKK